MIKNEENGAIIGQAKVYKAVIMLDLNETFFRGQ